jgi:hypothetical protein
MAWSPVEKLDSGVSGDTGGSGISGAGDGRRETPVTGAPSSDGEDLVESQGVNAGPPVDEEPPPAPETGSGDAGRHDDERPPGEHDLDSGRNEEMVGLPEQRPGYPGQQRSVDTS